MIPFCAWHGTNGAGPTPTASHLPRGQQPQGRSAMSTSTDLKARKAAAVPNGVGTKGIYVAKAENSELWDVAGRPYIDFPAGIAGLNTGPRHPKIMAAAPEKAEAFAETS